MALQPAAGAKDLNPRDVERNRQICNQLAAIYRLWGYQEVTPPSFERLDTLEAGGAINGREVVRLSSDEPLGLRPELTASIARAASTRMAQRPRPLRLWAAGPTFRSTVGDSGRQRVSEQLQSGVELLGVASAAADAELMRLLLAAAGALGLQRQHKPTLLVGHHGLLTALLNQIPGEQRSAARAALTGLDALGLQQLDVSDAEKLRLGTLMRLRGEPVQVLYQIEQWLGPLPLINSLAATLASVTKAASSLGVTVQLDPTFQPHFALYDGLVLKLVCHGPEAPVELASGGRYDALVGRFCSDSSLAAGMGFGFNVEAIRELLDAAIDHPLTPGPLLVAYGHGNDLAQALDALEALHQKGFPAELLSDPVASQGDAESLAQLRGCAGLHWVGP
jgi:ATP phosphoribosyltransferase regulatory subunit